MAKKHLEPAFKSLIDHTESVRTPAGIMAFKALMKRLNADKLSISLCEDGAVHIQVSGDGRQYSVWHYTTGDAELSGYNLPEQGDPIKTDHYDTRGGVDLSNGWLRGGE